MKANFGPTGLWGKGRELPVGQEFDGTENAFYSLEGPPWKEFLDIYELRHEMCWTSLLKYSFIACLHLNKLTLFGHIVRYE